MIVIGQVANKAVANSYSSPYPWRGEREGEGEGAIKGKKKNPFYPSSIDANCRESRHFSRHRADSSKAFNTWKMKISPLLPPVLLLLSSSDNVSTGISIFISWNGTSGGWMILAWMLAGYMENQRSFSGRKLCVLFFKRSILLFRSSLMSVTTFLSFSFIYYIYMLYMFRVRQLLRIENSKTKTNLIVIQYWFYP